MANAFETLKLDKKVQEELAKEIKPEQVYEGKTLPAGLYPAVVDKAYIKESQSGAKGLVVDFNVQMPDGEVKPYSYIAWVASGDEKGNKSTYTDKKTGKERPLPGYTAMVKFLRAIDSEDAQVQEATLPGKDGAPMTVQAFQGLQGKKLMIGIRQEENLYEGNITIRNDIQYWLNEDGKNEEGEDLKEKVAEKLASNPIKKLKTQPAATNAAAATPGTAPSGW